jgi:hypothetical protein
MTSTAQLNANRENAKLSTGPATESGRENASRNALTLGLYTREDYVKPEDREIYREFCRTMRFELAPEGLVEETLTAEIVGASWRLRLCTAAESHLTDFLEDEKTARSIQRARAAAHSFFHRSLNQLRRLQTERASRFAVNAVGDDAGLADYRNVTAACLNYEKLKEIAAENRAKGAPGATADPELASICNLPLAPIASAGSAAPIARNAPCPCKSGEKYKRCCGRNAPPVLSRAA